MLAVYPSRLYYAMYALQHRGQESAGISTFDGTSLCKFKGQGLVADVFSPAILKDLKGTAGIGHVRYPTTGANLPENIQPLNFQFQDHFISVAHNGNLVNTCELRREYEEAGQIFTTTTDTEIIAKILIGEISVSGSVEDAVHLCMKRMEGSSSVVIMIDGVIYAFRDPLGIKPFCLGKIENGYIVASENPFLMLREKGRSQRSGLQRCSTACRSCLSGRKLGKRFFDLFLRQVHCLNFPLLGLLSLCLFKPASTTHTRLNARACNIAKKSKTNLNRVKHAKSDKMK